MNNKHYTSIEQSKKLLSLGIDPETADMSWRFDIENQVYCRDIAAYKDYSSPPNWIDNSVNLVLPCWSVGSLLGLIPKHTKFNTALRIVEKDKIIWAFECHAISEYEFSGTSDIECLYDAVVWLLENNYINKKDKI